MEEESVTTTPGPETRDTVFTYDDIATPARLQKIKKDLQKRNVQKYCNLIHKLVQYNIPAGPVYSQCKDLLWKCCEIPDNPSLLPGWTTEQLHNHVAVYILLYFSHDTGEVVGELDD